MMMKKKKKKKNNNNNNNENNDKNNKMKDKKLPIHQLSHKSTPTSPETNVKVKDWRPETRRWRRPWSLTQEPRGSTESGGGRAGHRRFMIHRVGSFLPECRCYGYSQDGLERFCEERPMFPTKGVIHVFCPSEKKKRKHFCIYIYTHKCKKYTMDLTIKISHADCGVLHITYRVNTKCTMDGCGYIRDNSLCHLRKQTHNSSCHGGVADCERS